MEPYVMAEDLYQFKLALVLGRGKRLKKILKHYPTEKMFKKASLNELARVIGIKNLEANILHKLKMLDATYDEMVTFMADPEWSKMPRAKRIMGIDTEYLKSELDCIQYVVMDKLEVLTSGIVFTNHNVASAITVTEGIDFLRQVIADYKPDIIVGHNFNSDITVLESAYQDSLPELHFYDDTMDLMRWSNLANIIGGFSLNKAIKNVFKGETVGLFSAYNDLELLIEYGIKDAFYPIFLRYYIINGQLPEMEYHLKIDNIVKEENRSILTKNRIHCVLGI